MSVISRQLSAAEDLTSDHRRLFHYYGQSFIDGRVRARNDVNADQLTDTAGRSGTGVGRGLYGGDVAADDRGDESGPDLFIADKLYIRSLDHRVGGLDHCNEAFALDHS
jgi:hypothetical protein